MEKENGCANHNEPYCEECLLKEHYRRIGYKSVEQQKEKYGKNYRKKFVEMGKKSGESKRRMIKQRKMQELKEKGELAEGIILR